MKYSILIILVLSFYAVAQDHQFDQSTKVTINPVLLKEPKTWHHTSGALICISSTVGIIATLIKTESPKLAFCYLLPISFGIWEIQLGTNHKK